MRRTLFLILSALVLLACGTGQEPALEQKASTPLAEKAPSLPAAPGAVEVSSASERLLIREAELQLRAVNPRSASDQATALSKELGGYLHSSSLTSVGEDAQEFTLHLLVPSEDLERALSRLRQLGDVLHERVSGQDVTEESTDLKARLRTLRKLETRLLSLAENSAQLSDLLTVEKELARVRTEIEQREGRAQALHQRAAMASIHFTASSPEQQSAAAAESFGSRLMGSLTRSLELMVTTAQGIIVALGFLLPLSLVLAAGLLPLLLVRRLRKGRARAPA